MFVPMNSVAKNSEVLENNNKVNKSPKQLYQQALSSGHLTEDPAQEIALEALQEIHQYLQDIDLPSTVSSSNPLGLYLWGKVGRGKTFLMDVFVSSMGVDQCLRQHFHHFMQDVHSRLTELEGVKDPLQKIAKELAEQYQVLCFDEFFVNDIGDAMLLGRLMMFIFDEGMMVVATSNTEPCELYKDGLQRDSFIPAIKAIEQNLKIINMMGLEDHRQRSLDFEQNYFLLNKNDQKNFENVVRAFSLELNDVNRYGILDVLGREIMYLAKSKGSIAFDFQELCMGPRSHFDYIEIAKQFHTVFLYKVPCLGGDAFERIKARGTEDGSVGSGETGQRHVLLAPNDDAARRFIALVDELYDQKVRLYLCCEVSLNELYTQGSLSFQFERAYSRLIEMASKQYMNLGQSDI
jgi:cell division protein ZapE